MRCGLLGRTLRYSYSPQIHALLAPYEYTLIEKREDELDAFLRGGDFDGLNVTIPYKMAVMPYCAALSEAAQAIGSVNTLVRRPDGTLYGDNTDARGFRDLVLHSGLAVRGKKVLVLGSGGASRAICHVLRQLGAGEIVIISRSGENNYENLDRHRDAALLVNTTPVGTYPGNGAAPLSLAHFPALEGVFDLIYNPVRTALCLDAEARGIPAFSGLRMLVSQARGSAELFTGAPIADEAVDRICRILSAQMENVILIGMPGSGKTSVGQALAEALQRPFVDADAEIAARAGTDIPAYFAKYGEAAFRDLEAEVLSDLGKRSGIVLSTGGGCILREENYPSLHQNGRIFWLRRDLAALPRDGRPLSQNADLSAMYEVRAPRYARFADAVIENSGTVPETAAAIKELLL